MLQCTNTNIKTTFDTIAKVKKTMVRNEGAIYFSKQKHQISIILLITTLYNIEVCLYIHKTESRVIKMSTFGFLIK